MTRALSFILLTGLCGCVDDGGTTEDEPTDGGVTADGASLDGMATADSAPDPDGAPPDAIAPDVQPPDAFVVPPGAAAGSPCVNDGECRGGSCMNEAGWPEGYCTGDCDGSCTDGVCSGFGNFCGARCIDDTNCRDGYRCVTGFDGGNVCLPDPDSGNFDRVDGEPCEADAECRGGTCITDWPGGYCTTLGCTDRDDCASDGEDNRCLRNGQPFCIRICQAPDDCRPGYLCQAVQQGLGICVPNPNQPFITPEERDAHPLNIECHGPERGNQFRFEYEVAAETTSYLFVPFSATGEVLQPRRIERPEGQIRLDGGANAFQSVPARLFGGINPTLLPAHDELADNLMPGAHTYVLDSNAQEVCAYLLEETSEGTTIDLNVYLIGVRGMTADTAADNEDMQAVLGRMAETYEQAGIAMGAVRFVDPPMDVLNEFQIIRGQDEIGALLEHTTLPGPTRDEVLSLNVVFAREFAFANGQGTLGVSMGLPGPAALHGSRTSGVVFTAEYLGRNLRDGAGNEVDGNIYTGNVLAHEVGHYLGLFHTSEVGGRGFDPLSDTPECRNNFPEGCPDLENLMFPLARASASVLSPLQLSTIRYNPLTKD
jgi:hypothetical protein